MPKKAAKAKPKAKKIKETLYPEPKVSRAKKEPNPLEPYIGSLVKYYNEGWRYGYLDSTDGEHVVCIRPIAAVGTTVRCHRYPNTDVTIVEVKSEPVAK